MGKKKKTKKQNLSFEWICLGVALCVVFGLVTLAIGGGSDYQKTIGLKSSVSYASVLPSMPVPGEMVVQSQFFVPVLLKGMTIHPEYPFRFDFIVDSGNTDFSQEQIKEESGRLVKYFLASITIPKDDLWVNLSPYESERIIPEELGKTDLGRDMLAQDYLLKQLTASLMYPKDKLGSKFWKRVYKKAKEKFGTTKIPINTFNKVWIVPESATVYENGNTAYVVESRLKVMLEEDYLALKNNKLNKEVEQNQIDDKQVNDISSQIIREIILPEIEKEVNYGKNFTTLRQLYHSLILAKWYEETIKETILNQVYVDQNKVAGIDLEDKNIKNKIYNQYVEAYKKGVFDFINEDYDESTRKVIPRRYFSGGETFANIPLNKTKDVSRVSSSPIGDNFQLSMRISPLASSSPVLKGDDNAIVAETPSSPEGKKLIEKGLTFLRNEFKNSYEKILHFLEIDEPSSVVSLGRYEPAERDQGDGRVTYHYVITLQDMKKIEFFIKKTDNAEKEVDITKKAHVGVDGISIAPKVEFLQEDGQGYVLTLPALGKELSVSYFTEEIAYSIGRSLAILHSLGIRHNELSHEIHSGIDLFRSEHIFVSTKDGDALTQFIDFGLSSIGSDNGQETRWAQSAVGLHGFYANNDNRNSSIVFQLGYYETAAKIREGIPLNDGSSNLSSDKTFLIDVLLSILVDRDESGMLDAIRILGYLKDNRAADVLGEILLDENIRWIQLREEAAQALVKIDNEKAQEFLVRALKNNDGAERPYTTFLDTLAAITVSKKIGFNISRFPENTRIDFDEMNRLYEAAVNSGKHSNGELTEEDVDFLRYYNNLFVDEYYNHHTMSGYYNYAIKGANGVNQRPDLTEPKAKAIVENLGLEKGAKVLDIGCAFGYFVQDLRKLGMDAEGLEISKFAIENSDTRYRKYLHLLDSLNFRGRLKHKSYDLIILKDVLEHIPAEILPRFWRTISSLGAKILVTLPISDEDGEFINPRDRLDFTHVIKKNENWWSRILGYESEKKPDLNSVLKEGQEAGTFCALIDMSKPLDEKLKDPGDSDNAQMSDIQLLDNLHSIEITDSERILHLLNQIADEYGKENQLMIRKLDIFFTEYKQLLLNIFEREEPELADYLYYKVFYKFNTIMKKKFSEGSSAYDLFVKSFVHIADLSHRNDNDVVKIALLGTAMVRAEPIKKDDYFKGKVQKKYLSPPFGVYRLEKFLYERFREEIAQGRLIVDVLDPSLAYVSEEESLEELFDALEQGNYDFIGFSPIRVLLGEDLLFMNKVHEVTSKGSKKPIYIAGGNEASMNSKVVFESMPWLDFGISGLGEPVLDQMLTIALDSQSENDEVNLESKDFKGIGGLIYFEDGKEVRKERSKVNHEEFVAYSTYYGENIPYNRYWKHNHSMGPVDITFAGTRIETVRIFTRNFCPYNCPFCSQTIFGSQVYEGKGGSLPVDLIGGMVRRAYEVKGAKGIYFNDDDMFGSKQNAKDILNKIIEMKKSGAIPEDMIFHGQTRVDMVDEEILRLTKEAGFLFLSFGVESFSDESLTGKDLRKSFKAEQALNSVRQALKAKVPITNINLILFHPTVKKEAFITTVEKTMELLKVSIEEGARLSVNSFPLIEAYAGAPINEVAAREGWPVTKDTAVTENGNFEYVVSYLPIDSEMRMVVEDNYLMKEFNDILARLVKDNRWPSATVSRSIGINSLVMFMAAYKILNISENESTVQIKDMENLIWNLIEKFNPSVERASNIFSEQRANIVFTKKYGNPLFRRSGMEIEGVPKEIISKFSEKLDKDLLISFQSVDPRQIRDALHAIYYTDISVEDAFEKFGIKCFKEFSKVLLVAPWGNYDGTPLKTVVPHTGLEQINYSLIRDAVNQDVDCRVFNPNLVGRDKLKELLQEEDFDVIAFSFMPVLLKNDAPLIDDAARYAPNALLIAGGLNIARLPFKDLFGTLPFDVYLIGPGEQVLSGLLRAMSKGSSKSKNLEGLKYIPNLVYFHEGQIQRTEQRALEFATQEENAIKEDVPYIQADLTHGTTYSQETHGVHSDILPYDMIGTNRLYVKISDICKGKCIFCSAPKERVKPVDLDEVIEFIKKNEGSFDSIHFSDNDLLYNRDLVMALTEKIMEAGLENIPKVAKSRTDEVDPELLRAMRRAGFRILTFGVESFDDGILREMRKGTTADENRRALDMTLQEGIRPGMDMIFFSPWEDFNTLKTSLESALAFVERGAYLSLVPHMAIQMGDQTSKSGKVDIEYEDIFFRSTGKTLHNPLKAKLSDALELFRKKVLSRRLNLITELKESLKDRNGGYVSFSVEGLLFAKAVYQLFIEEGIFTAQELNYSQMIQKIDRLIVRTIELEVAKYRGLPELYNNIESDRDAAIAEIKFKMKKKWDTQDSQIEDIIRGHDRDERLMKNKSILDNKEDFFGLTAFLNHSWEFVDEMKSVQMEIAKIIDDQEKLKNPNATRTKKALYTDVGTAHVTLNGNIMKNWDERKQVEQELQEEFKDLSGFDLNVVGPHLMGSFAVTFELESDDWHLYRMKKRGKVISERRNPQATNPDIIHSSIVYIYEATEDQLLALNNKLREIREKNQQSSIAISVDTLSVTKGGMDRRFRTEDTPWRLDINLKQADSSMVSTDRNRLSKIQNNVNDWFNDGQNIQTPFLNGLNDIPEDTLGRTSIRTVLELIKRIEDENGWEPGTIAIEGGAVRRLLTGEYLLKDGADLDLMIRIPQLDQSGKNFGREVLEVLRKEFNGSKSAKDIDSPQEEWFWRGIKMDYVGYYVKDSLDVYYKADIFSHAVEPIAEMWIDSNTRIYDPHGGISDLLIDKIARIRGRIRRDIDPPLDFRNFILPHHILRVIGYKFEYGLDFDNETKDVVENIYRDRSGFNVPSWQWEWIDFSEQFRAKLEQSDLNGDEIVLEFERFLEDKAWPRDENLRNKRVEELKDALRNQDYNRARSIFFMTAPFKFYNDDSRKVILRAPDYKTALRARQYLAEIGFEKNIADKIGIDLDHILNERPDSAMVSSPSKKGGIDMNNINVNRQGAGVDIQFDPAMMQEILNNGVDGFAPVIINLTPINSIMPLLGLEPRSQEEKEYELSVLN